MSAATTDSPILVPDNNRISLRWPWRIASVLFLCLVLLLLLQAAMHKEINHDEHMYMSSGALLLQSAWPYADYPYFQMPLLTLVYGAAFSVWGDLLLVARLINVLSAFGACLFLFFIVIRALNGTRPSVQHGFAAASVILYVSGPIFVYTSGLAWNHDLPLLFTLAALFVLLRQNGTGLSAVPVLLSGTLIGLAASSRLLFIVAIIPFALFLLLTPGSSLMVRLRLFLTYLAGILLGLLPCLPFFIASPTAFIFGNIAYHNLNEQYWQTLNYERAMTLPTKFGYSFDVLMAEPASWLLLLGVLVVLLLCFRARMSAEFAPVLLCIATALALFVGALVPTPTWLQYFYAPYALLAVTLAFGTASLIRSGKWRIAAPLFSVISLVSALFSIPHYQSTGNLLFFDGWAPFRVAEISREIEAAVPSGRVITLSPVYPLQSGLSIEPLLATGPFGLRVANTLPAPTRRANGLRSAEDLVAEMRLEPPEGILVGAEGLLESPLTQFAIDAGYRETRLSTGLVLWLRPDQ